MSAITKRTLRSQSQKGSSKEEEPAAKKTKESKGETNADDDDENISPDDVLMDSKTKTLWRMKDDKKWECAVCDGTGYLCRGCGGTSGLYPHVFGICGENVVCPNCSVLFGPVGTHCRADYKLRLMVVEYWDVESYDNCTNFDFVTFFPKEYWVY